MTVNKLGRGYGMEKLSDSVKEWLETELRCHRYWCIAGPAGRGWTNYNIVDKSKYEERRDWIERILGKSIDCDPWKARRISEQNSGVRST